MEKPLTARIRPDGEAVDLKAYERAGGYQALRKALLEKSPKELIEEVKDSNLRGRGGAGFPTGLKWSLVPTGDGTPQPRYVAVNADEMEPGTFKDRLLLEGDPHSVIEGAAIAVRAIEGSAAYIFLRGEYVLAAQRLRRAIGEAYAAGYLGKNVLGSGCDIEVHLHISAGRYMCGEETGLLNALEGKRANPRTKPPFPVASGLWGKPTVINNVETLANVPHIINNGAEWFKSLSRSKDGGTKLYGASGKVKRPGLWELPMGTTAREILEEHAGGMRDGLKLRGFLPGGASTDFLTAEHLDVKMDFTEVQKFGSRMGTGTIIVLDDATCPVGMTLNLEHFFAQESCGWCTPCWSGLSWAERILQAIEDGRGEDRDLDDLEAITKFVAPGNTFCALAPGAAEPLQSALKYFRGDFERHIREKRCPWPS
ncbi:MAG TPA: NADH-quinone oxidoreductase subunit NuoF [Bryobacteraceae bacterium]|nr:NADH-quinone oxidoreductase subunit NuoF [Bryobacteraceae bacterium]HOL71736.1 NADH-quinone oxidoreductase subunit NuoF [Bryobacteraceae bacterium]HOQ44442.1 NADH-quinone oxidoreductase subunit NuoF [Bryobacteraceae bacterium]HPU70761.1 NADH-quinone oxidoreductase subunit NuoF [Bryobacteraceae bacterium]